jgi:hypothetical protein
MLKRVDAMVEKMDKNIEESGVMVTIMVKMMDTNIEESGCHGGDHG